MSEPLVFRPTMPGDDLTALGAALTDAFVQIRAALEVGRPVVVVLRAADLEGQGSPLDAALASGILGMVRTLAIEGAKPGWRINVVAGADADADATRSTVELLADPPFSGQLLQTGGANLGKVIA